MQNFVFQNPVKILFGKGQIAEMPREIPTNARVMITYGGGSAEKSGVLGQVREALKRHHTVEFGGISANPEYAHLIKAVELARKEKIDFLLAVGGGSVIDGTKFIAAAIPFEGEPWDIVSKSLPVQKALPLGTVLTLPATGSEMNHFAVISRAETKDKIGFNSPKLFPQFSVLDPTATFSLPPRQIANGIVDAFIHVMEGYTTYPDNAPLHDRMAEGVLQTLIEEGPKTLKEPQDYIARANMMWCATMGLNGLLRNDGTPQDWSSHAIGHELTALYGLDHGQTLAMVLPANLRVRKVAKHEKILQYAKRVWKIDEKDEDKAIDGAIDKTIAFFESLGVPTKMSGYNKTCDIQAVLDQLERHKRTKLGERGDVNLQVVRKILEQI